MIDKWFKKDLQNIYDRHSVAVFIDESGDAEFLLKTVENDYIIHKVGSDVEELHIKYLIEKNRDHGDKFLIYTNTKRNKLKFIREYCETNGCLEINKLHNYIRDKVHETLNLNINLKPADLLDAAKLSVGKTKTYWIDISHKGTTEIFDLEKELLPFIHDPVDFEKNKYDAQLRTSFYRKVNELLHQEYIAKPPETLATEVVKLMLDGLSRGKCLTVLKTIYDKWLDSVSYKDSFQGYLDNYKLPAATDIWSVDPSHPFRSIDEQWLKDIGTNIGNKTALAKQLKRVKLRQQNKQAQALGVTFWADVITLIEFDPKDIAYLSSFAECVEFYTKHFYQLDRAVRNLYTKFMNRKGLLEPFHEYYREQVAVFLDKWFNYFDEYEETQTGILQAIIDDNKMKTAVIVGDGVAYEVACQIADKVNKKISFTEKIIIADIPSETENNMSRIYMDNGITEKIHSNREKYLIQKNPETAIEFINLDDVNEDARSAQFLICTYKDIDSMGEKLQQKALKYFTESIDYFAEKVSTLLNSGYAKVYLISDHGFVLTGILTEADKISIALAGVSEKSERYIRTTDQQTAMHKSFIEIKKQNREFSYLYFAQNMNPFKTPSAYGFAHGGATPQEIITPYFCWERTAELIDSLTITIANKADLKSVTGELYMLNIETASSQDALFSQERKVFLLFFSDNIQINKSDVFIIKQDQHVSKEYTFDGHPVIEVQLLDAKTKELLDQATIKQNKDRDLGGLL
jgi:PglZ domain-containing protein